jgi:DNA modification methylase
LTGEQECPARVAKLRPLSLARPTGDNCVTASTDREFAQADGQIQPLTTTAGEDGGAQPPPEVSPRNKLNDLSAREWMSESVSVWTQKGLGAKHTDAQIEREHPAPFSFTDVARLIRLFTKRGMTVLDPFVGVGSTLKACALENRNGIGMELNQRFATEVPPDKLTGTSQVIKLGDSRTLITGLPSDSVDFLVTSPPYWGILNKRPDHKVRQERLGKGLATRYSDDPHDFANIPGYDDFVVALAGFFGTCRRVLKDSGHCVIILGDFRHGGRYYPLHADLAREMEERGYVLKAMNVLYQRHKRVFPYGYPAAYVPNVHHQNIIVLRNEKLADEVGREGAP